MVQHSAVLLIWVRGRRRERERLGVCGKRGGIDGRNGARETREADGPGVLKSSRFPVNLLKTIRLASFRLGGGNVLLCQCVGLRRIADLVVHIWFIQKERSLPKSRKEARRGDNMPGES